MLHDLLKGPPSDHLQLQGPNPSSFPRPNIAHVHKTQVHRIAAALQDIFPDSPTQLQEDHIVARLRGQINVASEVHDLELLCCQELGGPLDCQLQVPLAVLVDVYAQDQVPSAHKLKLWRRVVKASNLYDVSQPVTV